LSASSFLHVLALLDDDSEAMWGVLDRAVELADAENARLTLATPSDPGPVVSCFCGLCGLVVCAVPVSEAELQAAATNRLARAAEFVPASIPLTTVVLGNDTARALRGVVESGCHDLLIARERMLAHNRRLRRAIHKLGIATLTVCAEPVAQSRLLSREALRPRPAAQT
jgi:hypothetical protein